MIDRDYPKILYGLLAVFSADKIGYFLSKLIPICSGLLNIIQLAIAAATLSFILIKIAQARQQIKFLRDQQSIKNQKLRGRRGKKAK